MPRLLAFRKRALSALRNFERAQLDHNFQRAHIRPVHIPSVELAANAVNRKRLEHAACLYQEPLSFSCSESPVSNLSSTQKKRISQTSWWKFWKDACNLENISQRGTICAPHYRSSGKVFSSISNLRPRMYSTRQGHSSFQDDKVDVVIIGAGVIGLAIARRLAHLGREVLVLEAEDKYGTGTSSRNSEVIHGGLYYQTGSLKAQLCVKGNKMLYDYANSHNISHKKVGKLVVACGEDEIPKLIKLYENAKANCVPGLEWMTPAEAKALEPNVHCSGALLSRSSGVIDSHGLMAALLADAEGQGATLAVNSTVTGGNVTTDGIAIDVTDSNQLKNAEGTPATPDVRLNCSTVINAAGLDAQAIAGKLHSFPPALVPRRYLARGNYFTFSGGQSPFSHLLYPIPPEGGLGVHVTVDLGGQCKFGPDVEWLPEDAEHPIASYDYTVDPSRAASFYAAIREYYPCLPDGSLEPAYSGIRPKLFGPGQADVGSTDFMIQGPSDHGIAGLVNLYGIESPGLTACMAIAEMVAEKLAVAAKSN